MGNQLKIEKELLNKELWENIIFKIILDTKKM
jgi:hypothetical protein